MLCSPKMVLMPASEPVLAPSKSRVAADSAVVHTFSELMHSYALVVANSMANMRA